MTFIIMVLAVIPWGDFGVTVFENTDFLTGSSLGGWWFSELSMWFVIMAVIIGIVYGMKEGEIIGSFMEGAADMVGVALVIIVISIIAIVDMTSIKDTIKLDKELSELFGGDYDPESYIAYQEFMSTTFYIVIPACVIAIMDVIRSFFNNRVEWEKSNPIVVNNKVSNNAIIKPVMKKKPTKRGKVEIQY